MSELVSQVADADVGELCKSLFEIDLYPTQEEIVRSIVLETEDRITINTYTQYGKTFSIGVGLALKILEAAGTGDKLEIAVIAPTESDSENVKRKLLDAGLESPLFRDIIDTGRGNDPSDLKKRASKEVITFNDGDIVLQRLSASSGQSGQGQGLMGSGADIVVLDESNRVPRKVYRENITRMLNSEDAVLIEAGNPIHKDNQFYQHCQDPQFRTFHVSDEKGVDEDRHSKMFFERKARELGGRDSRDYKVLYKSEFPDQVRSALIRHDWIQNAKDIDLDLGGDCQTVYGLDVADMGKDKTVLTEIVRQGSTVCVREQWVLSNSDDTAKTARWAAEHMNDGSKVIVDYAGIGAGVWSKLSEMGFDAVKFMAGENPESESERFLNKKARNFFKVRDMLQDGDMVFKDGLPGELFKQLTHVEIERSRKDKIKIEDPDSGSPDFADSLMMALYQGGEVFIL